MPRRTRAWCVECGATTTSSPTNPGTARTADPGRIEKHGAPADDEDRLRNVIADELLARLRVGIGQKVGYGERPVQLGGGFYTANYRFSVNGGPAGWSCPMVLRLFPKHAPDQLDTWEAAVQTFVHDGGVPAPPVTLREPGSTIEGRRWFVMELLSGSPAMEGINAGQLLGGFRRMVRDMPRQTAEVHLALHRLDPTPLVDSFGDLATVERFWAHIATPTDEDRSHPLAPGVEWLTRNVPDPRSPLVLCHGDSWGGNLLVDDGRVTGLIDWTVATVAEPALDVAFLTTALSLAPVAMPRPIQRVAQRVGRRLATAYRSVYESQSDADLSSVPYYEALRCLLELNGVVSYRTTVARGLTYDSPRPTWDGIADQMVSYFEERTGVRLVLPPPVH
jgi:aminoglycoside phosphotransferase (APT) family kinase protein